jgi:hypothetical protein
MSDTTKVRIGLEGVRELEFEVEDASELRKAIEDIVTGDQPMVWLTDTRGHSYGVVADKVAFVEIEGEALRTGIGFGG